MSNAFQAGKTYKMNNFMTMGIKVMMQAEFKGEDGVFTVKAINARGHAVTDDITSPLTTDVCTIPPHISMDCEEVVCK